MTGEPVTGEALTTVPVTERLALPEPQAQALEAAIARLLEEPWDSPTAALVAPDLVFDLCTQYVCNTRATTDRWDDAQLAEEFLRQMGEEGWSTVRGVAGRRPLRGSRLTRRMVLSLTRAALLREGKEPAGQLRSFAMVLRAYTSGALALGQAAAPPFEGTLSHRDLRRWRVDPEDAWGGIETRRLLASAIEAGALRHPPTLEMGWRNALLAVALARRGAAATAKARGESEVARASLDQALERVLGGAWLREGRLWRALTANSLVRDITVRFLSRRSSIATLVAR